MSNGTNFFRQNSPCPSSLPMKKQRAWRRAACSAIEFSKDMGNDFAALTGTADIRFVPAICLSDAGTAGTHLVPAI